MILSDVMRIIFPVFSGSETAQPVVTNKYKNFKANLNCCKIKRKVSNEIASNRSRVIKIIFEYS